MIVAAMAKHRYLRAGDECTTTTRSWCEADSSRPTYFRTTLSATTPSTAPTGSLCSQRGTSPSKSSAQEPPLIRFAVLTLVRVGARDVGFRLEPSGRNTRHFTVAFDDLDAGVAALVRCEHQRWDNPYHEG